MGNCALKPKVLSEAGVPAPEELKDSLLEYQKIDAAKSLSNLFLQDKAEKKTREDEKITPEKMAAEDLKTALEEEKEAKSPATETKYPVTPENMVAKDLKTALAEEKSPATETKYPVTPEKMAVNEDLNTVLAEAKAPADDQKVKNEEAVYEEKVIDIATVKETETEAKAEEVGREAA